MHGVGLLGHRSVLGLLWASRPSASTSASTSTSTSTSTGRPGRPGRSPLAGRPPARRALGLALLQADLGLHHHLVREPTGYPVFISAIYDVSYDGKAATDGHNHPYRDSRGGAGTVSLCVAACSGGGIPHFQALLLPRLLSRILSRGALVAGDTTFGLGESVLTTRHTLAILPSIISRLTDNTISGLRGRQR